MIAPGWLQQLHKAPCALCTCSELAYFISNSYCCDASLQQTWLQTACTRILLPSAKEPHPAASAPCTLHPSAPFCRMTLNVLLPAPLTLRGSRDRRPPATCPTPDQPRPAQPLDPTPARPGAAGAAAPAPRSRTPRWPRRPCSSRRPPSRAHPAGASPARTNLNSLKIGSCHHTARCTPDVRLPSCSCHSLRAQASCAHVRRCDASMRSAEGAAGVT